jgi:phytoene dehydrogenase-like protein
MKRAVVVGAGAGGLSTAGTLARAGLDVTVLEAHIDPGGCAGTSFSASPAWNGGRAPEGMRAVTLRTHTRLEPWWKLHGHNRRGYEARKDEYTRRVLAAAEVALPGLREAVSLVMPGTPVTFERFTRRAQGWVGGFPQTSLFRDRPPRIGRGLWMVGDNIFPGQSTAAVAMGGVRAARAILDDPAEVGARTPRMRSPRRFADRLASGSSEGRW